MRRIAKIAGIVRIAKIENRTLVRINAKRTIEALFVK